MDIIIRNARIEDIEAIADIKIDGWRTAYKGIIDDEFLDGMDRDTEINKRKNNIGNTGLIVAESNGEVVGFSLYRDFNKNPENYPNTDCEISSLYVKTSLKRKGLGRKMMKYVIEELQNKGKNKMILGCLKDNYPSRNFYEKMGGKILDYTKTSFGNKEYELVIYEYNIESKGEEQ